jgi:hypothetical protein
MAVSVTTIAHQGDATNTADYSGLVLTSLTGVTGCLYTLAIMASRAASTTSAPSVSGWGTTWVEISNSVFNSTATPRSRLTLLRTTLATGSGPGNISITFGASAHDGVVVFLQKWDGVDISSGTFGSGTIVQFLTGRANVNATPSITLTNSIGAGNATYAAWGTDTIFAPTAGSGYTLLDFDNMTAPAHAAHDVWRADGQQLVDSTIAGADWGGVAIEILAGGLVDIPRTPLVGAAEFASLAGLAVMGTILSPGTA